MGTSTRTMRLSPTSSTLTSVPERRFTLTLAGSAAVRQTSLAIPSGSLRPDAYSLPSPPTLTPSAMVPPAVLANAE